MKFFWQVEDSDIQKVRLLYDDQKNNSFVMNRIIRNVERNIPEFSKDIFWYSMISCLLTTQQRSGPDSAVTHFICSDPFPLSYSQCKKSDNLQKYVEITITDFGGLRRGKKIGEEVENNLEWLEGGGWKDIKKIFSELRNNENKKIERKCSEFFLDKDNKRLKGIGPKQSRNLLQSLGLTKYEIPLDSRIIKWLQNFGFPIILSPGALGDKYYYNFVLDAFQLLCDRSRLYPCVLDAAIFSSFDNEWPDDKLIW